MPPLIQGVGSGYVGDPKDSNSEAYYSLTGLSPRGTVVAGGQVYIIEERHGVGWLDHQYGSIGIASYNVPTLQCEAPPMERDDAAQRLTLDDHFREMLEDVQLQS